MLQLVGFPIPALSLSLTCQIWLADTNVVLEPKRTLNQSMSYLCPVSQAIVTQLWHLGCACSQTFSLSKFNRYDACMNTGSQHMHTRMFNLCPMSAPPQKLWLIQMYLYFSVIILAARFRFIHCLLAKVSFYILVIWIVLKQTVAGILGYCHCHI